MSNGAYFSHLLASQRSSKIAAIAVHSGGIGVVAHRKFRPKNKYAVMVIHGSQDSIVPVKEGYRAWKRK